MPNRDVLIEECCEGDDIIHATKRPRAQAKDILVETDDLVSNIAEVLIHVHRLRPVDILPKSTCRCCTQLRISTFAPIKVPFVSMVMVHDTDSKVFDL